MFWLFRLFLFAGIILPHAANAARVIQDDTGQSVSLSVPAKRILVLAPDLVENVFAIGAGSSVIGVVQGSDYPAAVKNIPQVGSYAGIDLERIAAMHPDLIVTWKYAFPRQVAALRRLHIPVYIAAPKQLQDVPRLMRQLGYLSGHEKTAEAAASQFESELHRLQITPLPAHPVKVFFQIDRYVLMTINRESWINQVIELCGGQNIFADAKTIAPEVDREAVLAKNPDIIFTLDGQGDWQKAWQAWPGVSAVRKQQLESIPPDLIARAGPRLVLGAEMVCKAIRSSV